MLGNLGRRAIDLAVLFLAFYAFAFVPLGHRTGLEHFRAILRTPAAKNAGGELLDAVTRLHRRLVGAEEPIDGRGAPVVPKLPRQARAPANAAVAPPDNAAILPLSHDAPDASQ